MKRAIKLILYYLGYQLLFIFLATGIDATITLISGGEVTTDFRPDTMAISIGMLLSTLAMTWHLVHFNYVRFSKENIYEVSKKVILLCIPLLLSAQFIAGILNEALDLTDTNQELFISMSHNIFGVISIAIAVPILEELLFRGAIEGHLLRKGWSPKWAIIISALIFGLIHGNPAQIPFAFLIGLLFGWLYYRTGSLIPGIAGHIINNSFGAWTMFTATKEELSQTTMETLGTTATYILLLLAIVIFTGIYFYLNKYLPKPTPIIETIDKQDSTI